MKPRGPFLRKAARQVLKECGITEPPVDLLAVIKKYGLEYDEVDYFDDDVDAMIIPMEGRVIAVVNKKSHVHRRRFSLAHELCHHLFHQDRAALHDTTTIDSPLDASESMGKDPFETEADIFAGELLVPLPMLKKHYRPSHTADDIAQIFNVSPAVASIAITSHFSALFK
jgi:Zn-dependent peptidase ImmA (M78 family)